MKQIKLRRLLLLSLPAAVFAVTACAPKFFAKHTRFNESCKKIGSYCLVKPEVEICEISAGGVVEIRDDWCARGLENVVGALQETLDQKGVAYRRVSLDADFKKEAAEIRALYRAVSQSIRTHALGTGPHVFPEKTKSFDYSIGPIDEILKKYGCDGLIIVYGTDQVSTSGRKALMALSAIAGAFTGVVIVPVGGMTTVNFALVDGDGNILWYNSKIEEGYDLRNPDSALKLIRNVVADYPQCKK